jgi:hypothetical protein
MYAVLSLSIEDQTNVENAMKIIDQVFKEILIEYPFTLVPYGSVVNGLGLKGESTDLDITLVMKNIDDILQIKNEKLE